MIMRELVVHWHVDPAILHIGNFELRWYSILFVSGFMSLFESAAALKASFAF